MMKISVWDGGLSDSYLKQVTQLGADCIDFGSGNSFPGVTEQGYPDLDEVIKIRKRIRSWGLDINRVTLARHHRDIYERVAGRGKRTGKHLQCLKGFRRSRRPHRKAAILGRYLQRNNDPLQFRASRRLHIAWGKPWIDSKSSRKRQTLRNSKSGGNASAKSTVISFPSLKKMI